MTRQRDEKGRFLPGNTVAKGHGRPPKTVERAYLDAFNEAATPDDFYDATLAVLEQAKQGDVAAYRVLAGYALGLPVARVQAQISQLSLTVELEQAIEKVFGDDDSN